MRRRIPYRVCSCTPNGVVTHLEARLLKDGPHIEDFSWLTFKKEWL